MANLPSRNALPTYILSFTALILHTSDRRAEIGFCRLVYFSKAILTLGIPILNISLIGEKRYLIIFFLNKFKITFNSVTPDRCRVPYEVLFCKQLMHQLYLNGPWSSPTRDKRLRKGQASQARAFYPGVLSVAKVSMLTKLQGACGLL